MPLIPRIPAITARRIRQAVARLQRRWLALPGNTRGALWIVFAGILFSIMAAMVKALGTRLDSFQVAFFRALFGLVAVLPFLWGGRVGQLKTRRPLMHLARGVMGASAMMGGFYAITHLPLADATALSFTRPLFVVMLSAVFLGEVVRLRRWTATAVGFAGVVIMMRPTAGIEFAAMVAVAAAMLVACVSIVLKKLTATESPVAMLFYFGVISSSIALIPALMVWRAPTGAELLVLMLIGAIAAAAQSLVIRGFTVAEASAVTAFDYTRIIFAATIGYFAFGNVPDGWALTGAVIIVGSTLYIARREARIARQEAVSDPPPGRSPPDC